MSNKARYREISDDDLKRYEAREAACAGFPPEAMRAFVVEMLDRVRKGYECSCCGFVPKDLSHHRPDCTLAPLLPQSPEGE